MEGFLKYTVSKYVLIFTIAIVGTRNIYAAIIITIVFGILFDVILNEDSRYCCLPESFTSKQIALLEENADRDVGHSAGSSLGIPGIGGGNSIKKPAGFGASVDSKPESEQEVEDFGKTWQQMNPQDQDKIRDILRKYGSMGAST
jgi:hypothetical protein